MDLINPAEYDPERHKEFTLALANTSPDRLNGRWIIDQFGIRFNAKLIRALETHVAPSLSGLRDKTRSALDGIIAGKWNDDLKYFKELHPHSKIQQVYNGGMLRFAPYYPKAEMERRIRETWCAMSISCGLQEIWDIQEDYRKYNRGRHLKRCPIHKCGVFHFNNGDYCSRKCRDKAKRRSLS